MVAPYEFISMAQMPQGPQCFCCSGDTLLDLGYGGIRHVDIAVLLDFLHDHPQIGFLFDQHGKILVYLENFINQGSSEITRTTADFTALSFMKRGN